MRPGFLIGNAECKVNGDAGASALFAYHAYRTAHELNDVAGYRKSETAAALAPCSDVFSTCERVEHHTLELAAHSTAIVIHHEPDVVKNA